MRPLACLLALAVAAPLAAVDLGGQQIPKEKFIVWIVNGDSNTEGTSSDAAYDWPLPNFWALTGDGSWKHAEPFPQKAWKFGPGEKAGKAMTPGPYKGRGNWQFSMMKRLAEAHPGYHFGICMLATGGPSYGDPEHNGFIQNFKPLVDQVTIGGMVCELKWDARGKGWADICTALGLDEQALPLIGVPRRDRFDGQWPNELRAVLAPELPAVESEKKARHGEFERSWKDGVAWMSKRPKWALVPFDGLKYGDNRHMYWNGGLEPFGIRYANTLIAKGWSVPGAPVDGEKPSTPAGVQAAAFDIGAKLTWTASTDNVAVKGYDVLVDGKKVGVVPGFEQFPLPSTAQTEHFLYRLEPGKTYQVQVVAVDYNDNASAPSAAVTVTTPAQPVYAKLPLKINVGGAAVGDWVADKKFYDGGTYGSLNHEGQSGRGLGGGMKDAKTIIASAFPDEKSEAAQVLLPFRCVFPAYRIQVPDGKYRVTWIADIKQQPAKDGGWTVVDHPLIPAAAKAAYVAVQGTVETKNGSLAVHYPYAGVTGNKGRGRLNIYALIVEAAN